MGYQVFNSFNKFVYPRKTFELLLACLFLVHQKPDGKVRTLAKVDAPIWFPLFRRTIHHNHAIATCHCHPKRERLQTLPPLPPRGGRQQKQSQMHPIILHKHWSCLFRLRTNLTLLYILLKRTDGTGRIGRSTTIYMYCFN